MLAIVCPGQGAQKPGFLSSWLEMPGAREQLERHSSAAGIDLIAHGTQSDADTIRDTAVAQPLLVAAGILAADALAAGSAGDTGRTGDGLTGGGGFAASGNVDLLAGHSVGEVTATALAGMLSAEDALRLVAVRSRAMAQAAAAEPTSMAAVVGGAREEVLATILEQDLTPANLNSGAQVVAAGAADAVTALAENAPPRARVRPLQVAGAFHTTYMEQARQELAEFVATLAPHDARSGMPLVSNFGGEVIADGARYLELIVQQVASVVDWEACMRVFDQRGVTGILELNPAGTLTGLAKRELKGVDLMNLNTPEDLDAAREFAADHATARAVAGPAATDPSEEN